MLNLQADYTCHDCGRCTGTDAGDADARGFPVVPAGDLARMSEAGLKQLNRLLEPTDRQFVALPRSRPEPETYARCGNHKPGWVWPQELAYEAGNSLERLGTAVDIFDSPPELIRIFAADASPVQGRCP